MTVKVYRYAQHSIEHDENLAHAYATMAFIILNKLSAVPDSEMDVDPSHVDAEGRYLGLDAGNTDATSAPSTPPHSVR